MTCKISLPLSVLADAQLPASTIADQPESGQQATNAAFKQPLEQSSTSSRLLHFTQSQLSLALSIQKSRPANIATRDYCLQLRKHITLGKPPKKEEQRHIDTAEFWRDQYSTLYLEKQRLANRVAQLELLATKSGGCHQTTPLHQEDNGPSFEEIFSNPLTAPAERRLSNRSLSGQSLLAVKELEAPNSLPLLKQLLILHRLLRDSNPPADILLSAILSLLSVMNATIKETCAIVSPEIRRNGNAGEAFAVHIFNTTAAAFNICLKGLQHLCRDIPGRRCKGQAIYAFIQFYKTCLDQLDELCVQEASYGEARVRQNENEGLNSQSNSLHRHSVLNSGYVDFLTKLLKSPELKIEHPFYMEVVEGLFSTLLEVTGGHLSQVIFGERLSLAEISGGIPSIPGDTPCPTRERAAELKGRQLAILLKRATKGRSDEEKQILATMLGGLGDCCTIPSTPKILMRARQRLQETLLRAVFGDDGREFLNALKIPEPVEGWNKESSQVFEGREGTFVEAVWSAVGWDLVLSV